MPTTTTPKPRATAAVGLQLPSHFHPTHETSGLPGFPAIDVFAAGGTKVYAPEGGTISRLSGHQPTPTARPGGPYGWSIYLDAPSGRYYLTHLGSRKVVVGQKIKRGQLLGTVADYAKATHGATPSHIHEGKHLA